MESPTEQGFWLDRRGVVWLVRDASAVQVHDTSSHHHVPPLDAVVPLDDERITSRGPFVRVTPLGYMTSNMKVVP